METLPLSHMLACLLNALAEHNEPLTLILDDYQVIEEPSIHQSFAFLLAQAPACLRLVLATRTDPPLPLSRLRARGYCLHRNVSLCSLTRLTNYKQGGQL